MATAKSGGKGRFREWCPTANGELRFWDVIVTRLPERGGGVARFLTVSRDITDIKRMKDALKMERSPQCADSPKPRRAPAERQSARRH